MTDYNDLMIAGDLASATRQEIGPPHDQPRG